MSIKVMAGGTVAQNETFNWENEAETDCDISGTGGFLTLPTYKVPKKKDGVAGTLPATVLGTVTGDFEYIASNGKKRGNPTIHVNDGQP